MEGEELNVFGAEERDAFYEKLNPNEEAPAEETVVTEAETETQAKDQYVAEPPVKEEAAEVKEEKTVPYGALKEEREKRKALQRDNEELQKRLQSVLTDFQTYVHGGKDKPEEQAEVIEDYDKEIIELKNLVKRQAEEITALKGTYQSDQQQKAKNEFQQRLNAVDADLLKEGYPGFNQFIGHVQQELQRIAEDDHDEAVKLDNPEGWKKIYKERVFNNLASLFVKKSEDDKKQAKEQAKKDAQSVVLTPGKIQTSSEPSQEESYEEYANYRRKGFARS